MRKNKKAVMQDNKVFGLSLGQKLSYGLEDAGCQLLIGLIGSFGMLYWGNVIGMNLRILGTLILISKVLDGITDVIAGTIIDRTKSKHGKARSWMIRTLGLMVIFGILLFAIPTSIPKVAQYAYFFIIYSVFNDILYTMNNIAFCTLSVRCTKKESDQVQLGTIRFMFSTVAGVVVGAATTGLVDAFGGGTSGWRMVAIVYSVIFGVCQIICILCLHELPEDETNAVKEQENPLKQLVDNIVYLIKNKYFLFHLTSMVLFTLSQQIMASAGIYYMKYILGNEEMLGVFSITTIALVAGLIFVPALTKKFGARNTIVGGLVLSCVMGIVFWISSKNANVPLMLISNTIRWFGCATFIGSATVALPGKISEFSLLRDHVNIEATVFSCVSMGTKVGMGLASAITGWLLDLSGFISSDNAVQPASALSMIIIIYAALPLVFQAIVLVCNYFQKVDVAVEKLKGNR